MYVFFIKDENFLEKYEIWKKVSNNIKKEFDSKCVYNKKYLKTKIKSYNGKINTNFCNNKIPKSSQCIYLIVILISVDRKDKEYYPQECKYVVKDVYVYY